jgi:peptidyl-tRNA hydrolase, PTH1 family
VKLKRVLRARTKKRPKTANSPVRVVVGLRNPGSDYKGTRHNIGVEVVERLLSQSGASLGKAPSRIRGMVSQIGAGDQRTLFLAPNTFMNDSGGPVSAAISYYKVETDDVLVVHDDIDLPFGRLRLQVAGGSGGHNGIRSVEKSIGTKEFSRLKVGVGRPPGSVDPAAYVLKTFNKHERREVELIIEDAADIVGLWLSDRAKAQESAALRGRNG